MKVYDNIPLTALHNQLAQMQVRLDALQAEKQS
jgi:hypothetical protein